MKTHRYNDYAYFLSEIRRIRRNKTIRISGSDHSLTAKTYLSDGRVYDQHIIFKSFYPTMNALEYK